MPEIWKFMGSVDVGRMVLSPLSIMPGTYLGSKKCWFDYIGWHLQYENI